MDVAGILIINFFRERLSTFNGKLNHHFGLIDIGHLGELHIQMTLRIEYFIIDRIDWREDGITIITYYPDRM